MASLVQRVFASIVLLQVVFVLVPLSLAAPPSSTSSSSNKKQKDESDLPPSFFLQDPNDSYCLGGAAFKRCSIDTLFYVVGKPGSYRIHKRPHNGIPPLSDNDDKVDGSMISTSTTAKCLAKQSCDAEDSDKIMPLIVTSCDHCGAKFWNILGDNDSGYVLTEGSDDDDDSDDAAAPATATGTGTLPEKKQKKMCVFRKDNSAMTAPCDSTEIPYTPLQLRFTTPMDIQTMSSPGATMISAANDGDLESIKLLLTGSDKVDINVRDWDELTALIPAASNGHYEICQYLVENGIDVNAADKDGITALMEASIMGHVTIVQYLLEKAGATVDLEASSDVTALWLASSEGQVECMKILLKYGASATNTRSDGITALMTAAIGGHVDAIQLLVEHGAVVTTVDKEGLTPLMNAAENGTVAVLQVLVEATNRDVDYINAASASGFTALIIASAHGHTKAVEYLLSVGAQPDTTAAENKVTALMFAAAANHVDAVHVLINAGCTVDAKHSNGGTALLEASTGGAVDAMKVLIDKGAAVDIIDNDGVTPLMAIASQGNVTGVNLMIDALKQKLNNDMTQLTNFINLHSHSGGSTVMFATAGGHANATRILMEHGANVHAIARATPEYITKITQMKLDGISSQEIDEHVDGVTALHVAAQGGHLSVVNILIEAGVDVNIKDDNERTSLLLAIKGNYGPVASALVQGGANPNTVYVDDDGVSHNLLFDSIMIENIPFALLLIEKGANIYYQDEKKVTTLLQASHRGLVPVVEALLEKHIAAMNDNSSTGSSNTNGITDYFNEPSDEGITPLIAASSEGHDSVVELLVGSKYKQYININAVDQDKTTALMASSARGHVKVVKALVTAGALINEQNMDGHTALMFAYNGKNQVETLWERYVQYVDEAKVTASSSTTSTDADAVVDDSGTGPIIRDALDNHIQLIDTLIKAGADTSIKDKEGHVAKDFDYHPDIDSTTKQKVIQAAKIKDESKYEL